MAKSWSRLLEATLDELAAELPVSVRARSEDVHGAVVGLCMRLAAVALVDRMSGRDRLARVTRALERGPASGWQALRASAEASPLHWPTPSVTRDPLATLEPGPQTVQVFSAWLDAFATDAARGLDGPIRELGALHEALLDARLSRLEGRACRLRRRRGWLELDALLDAEPRARAKTLKHELALGKHDLARLAPALEQARTSAELELVLKGWLEPGASRAAGGWVVQASVARRRSGAHYTPWPLCRELVERALGPLVASLPEPRSRALLELEVCDPAMGAGAFLVATAEFLAGVLASALAEERLVRGALADDLAPLARRIVAERIIRGVDKDAGAVALARFNLALFAYGPSGSSADFVATLRSGDALVGRAPLVGAEAAERSSPAGVEALDWAHAFPATFARSNPGFDALVGNPPWVAYVGRARQPLAPALARYFAATNPAFRRYRTLHGLFVYRAASLLREGGRLGLVLPTSVADLDGYRPTREAHDALCEVDRQLPDWGDGAFEGVFQPSMVLLSTRRSSSARAGSGVWCLDDHGTSAAARALLERLGRLAPFPPDCFGERGYQTTRDDQARLRRDGDVSPARHVHLREGADIAEFEAHPPRVFVDPSDLAGRLRPRDEWQRVDVLIRQTARFPIAALSDGTAFRNSIIAGFATERWSAALLVSLLNSALFRWLHYQRHRDARQGMPQLKIGHLRRLPAPPPSSAELLPHVEHLGALLSRRNRGIAPVERAELDGLIERAFGLGPTEVELVRSWAAANPPPTARRRASRAHASGPTSLSAE